MTEPRNSSVECQKCGAKLRVNFGKCLVSGWPTCCGETMYLKSTQANIEKAVDAIFAPVHSSRAAFAERVTTK